MNSAAPFLTCSPESDSEVIDCVAFSLAEGVSPFTSKEVSSRDRKRFESDRAKARKTVPHVLAYLDQYTGPNGEPIGGDVENCIAFVRRHVIAEAGGPLRGALAWFLLRVVAAQVAAWLVEWFFSQFSRPYRLSRVATLPR